MITQSTLEEIEGKQGHLYGILKQQQTPIYLGISSHPIQSNSGFTVFQQLSNIDKTTRVDVLKKEVIKNNNSKFYKQYQMFVKDQPVKIIPQKELNKILQNYIVIDFQCLDFPGTIVGYEYQNKLYKLGSEIELIEHIKQCHNNHSNTLKKYSECQMILKPIQYQITLVLLPQFTQNKFTEVSQNKQKNFKFIINLEKLQQNSLEKLFKEARSLNKKNEEYPSFIQGLLTTIPNKVWNPHLFLQTPSLYMHQRFMMKGTYDFYHYGDQSFNDNGWGCAYRAFQSLLTWFSNGKYSIDKVPSILEIQKLLFQIDKSQNRINTQDWIGANQVGWLINSYFGIDCKIVFLQDGQNIMQKVDIFKHHFQTVGTPIMYGGGQYAYTILGINYSWKLGECQFLILDPHYVGADDIKNIIDKQGVSWKDKSKLFKKGVYYNFCLPQVKTKP